MLEGVYLVVAETGHVITVLLDKGDAEQYAEHFYQYWKSVKPDVVFKPFGDLELIKQTYPLKLEEDSDFDDEDF